MTSTAAHRQTGYIAALPLDEPTVLPLPEPTEDLAIAQENISEYGMALVPNVLSPEELGILRDKLTAQAEAERNLGDLAPLSSKGAKQLVSNLIKKGKAFLDLVEREETDALAGYMLGKDFLISSLTGGIFHGPTTEPQPLHRDQGQVPATADFPAACNLFWILDDFTPARGSTCVVPGSHRWPAEHQMKPPSRDKATQITLPAGSIFAWDGRIWHGTGINKEGHPRRHIASFNCLPWMRQQENWGVTCLQEVLDEASPKRKVRLGLRTYGTLGMMSGTRIEGEEPSLGNYNVTIPDYLIGENGSLHKVRRTHRGDRK